MEGLGRLLRGARGQATDATTVRFFHEVDATQWECIKGALGRLSARCEEAVSATAPETAGGATVAPQEVVEGLLQALNEVRAVFGPVQGNLSATWFAAEKCEAVGLPNAKYLLPRVLGLAARLVTELPELFPNGLELLTQSRGTSQVFLSRRCCAALLSAGLLCALPPQSEGLDMPDFSFDYVLGCDVQKVLCLLSYLWQVDRADAGTLDEVVSFARRKGSEMPAKFWQELDKPLLAARVEDGVIEESDGSLQADFANEYLGGGVLHGGNVQEEIRFSVCPECLVGLLFCEKMRPEEAITIVGAQQYSKYSGYGGSFAFAGVCATRRDGPADGLRRLGPHIVALDALVFPGDRQYGEPLVLRELTKAYTACLGDPEEGAGARRDAFATGNWGCGVFGGDPQLKAMIQWLAASAADRQLVYFRYGDLRVDGLPAVIQAVQEKCSTCSELYNLLLRSCHSRHRRGGELFEHVLSRCT